MVGQQTIYKIAKTEEDYNDVFSVRKKIFVDLFRFKKNQIVVEKENSLHVLAKKNNIPIGVISMGFPDQHKKLFLDNFFDMRGISNKVELNKFAVIQPNMNIMTGAALIGIAYLYIKELGYENIVIGTPQLEYNVRLYKKFGYIILGECNYEHVYDIYLMTLKITDFDNNPLNKGKIKFAYRKYQQLIR